MGLFNKKTKEEKAAALEAKLEKAQAGLDSREKFTAKEREKFDETTTKHKITLMEAGLDVREASGIITRNVKVREATKSLDYMVTMPDAVVIYTVANKYSTKFKDKVTPVKHTETIPYQSIHAVDFTDGVFKNTITVSTSVETYEFETMEFGKFIVETINERRGN